MFEVKAPGKLKSILKALPLSEVEKEDNSFKTGILFLKATILNALMITYFLFS